MRRVGLLFLALMVPLPATAAWQSIQTLSPVDDSIKVAIIVEANSEHSDRHGKTGRANLQIICEENTTILALVFPGLWMSDLDSRSVVLRTDKRPAADIAMIASSDHSSLAVTGGKAIRHLKQMLGGSNLFVRATPVNEATKDFWFDISGIDAALKPVRKACSW